MPTVVAVLGATGLVPTVATDFPLWLSAAVFAGVLAGVAAGYIAPRWRLRATALSAALAAVLSAFAAEGVRGALTRGHAVDAPVLRRRARVPDDRPDTNAGEAVGTGLLFSGDTVEVVCLKGGSWAKLGDGSWVPEHAVQAEVDAESAPNC